jgi:hypothetical protein
MPSLARAPRVLVAVVLALPFVAPTRASAHFVLHAPGSWREQSELGDPQKVGPCGDEGAAATTGMVTAFAPGETITITIDEVIFHPGHYRVALAVSDRDELPAAPPVTPGTTDCGAVPIMETPVFPVLADGVLPHTEPFEGAQSFQVTLPDDVSCTHCTLQVLEFMSEHGAPCFYHHCADIAIGTGGGACETDDDCADANACTRDACSSVDGCVSSPMTLAAVQDGFLGSLDVAACTDQPVPAVVGKLFARADGLVGQAAEHPAKAVRLLHRAEKRLRKTGKKVTKMLNGRVSPACGSALGAAVAEAQSRLACLSGAG